MNAQAGTASELNVVGVVTPLGPFGLKTREDGWMLGFHVCPWRALDGPLQLTELRVTKPLPEAQIEAAKAALAATSVVFFSIRDLKSTEHGTHTARLEGLISSSAADPEMEAAAAELRAPVVLQTEHLGALRLDRRIDPFEGEIAYSGRTVQLSVPSVPNSSEIDASALAAAHQLVANLSTLDRKARQFASARLLELKNDGWLQEDEAEMSDAEFQQRLVLTAVSSEVDSRIGLYYDDGDIFLGHSIDVRGTVAGEFLDASISG